MPVSKLFHEITSLQTEQRNPISERIDTAPILEILRIINAEDRNVANAVGGEIHNIAKAVELVLEAFKSGGSLYYFGAGTSGRLGIIDAAECPPTFGSDPDMVQGVIAGGKEAVFRAQEGAEDIPENGSKEIIERNLKPPDIVCGIAASGRTPFVRGALEEAANRGIKTILITTVSREKIEELCINPNVLICPAVGPEVITGSTRMKSGTAQKLVLNMITTAAMVRLGKTYGNVMIDLQLTNKKLQERAKGIIMSLTGVSYDDAEKYLFESGGHVKTSLVMILGNVSSEKAHHLLNESDGFVRLALEKAEKK